MRFLAAGQLWASVEAWVKRAADQYRVIDDAYDDGVLSFLVERLLLGRKIAFPGHPAPSNDSPWQHNAVGYARANDEE